MSKSKKLRVTKRYREIFQVVSKSIGDEQSFLWTTKDSKIIKYPVKLEKVDAEENRIQLHTHGNPKDIKPNDILYLKLDYRDAAFKAQVVSISGERLTMMFPEEVALQENRAQPRYYFHPSEGKMAQIVTSGAAIGESENLHSLIVCDISEGGIAFFVPAKLKSAFEMKSKVRLLSLDGFKLGAKPLGEIIFSLPFEIHEGMSSKEGYKIGVRFESVLSAVDLERFILKQKVFSLDDQQIVRDHEFREQVKINVVQVRKELEKNVKFKKFLSTLDAGTGDAHYLKQHIHLLCQVMTGLGTRLGWISDRSIDKLIYVAYLHDIRFMNHPHMARIKSLKEFEAIQTKLSADEKAAFLEAPSYAAEVARQDLSSFPDAIKILLQQKELPDGSGFPHGLNASYISPLGSLFIASHYFVDYVIETPDWSISEFIKEHKFILKGQYFQKILQTLKDQ